MVNVITPITVYVDVSGQKLDLKQGSKILFTTDISTALNGVGERNGSEKTPRGWHLIRAKIGANEIENCVFVGRRKTGELYSETLPKQSPQRDWILTRILWLSGIEPGFNRLGEVDTMRRYIYIHGCPDSTEMGKAGSHGCIRMRNKDVIHLFDSVDVGTKVLITE